MLQFTKLLTMLSLYLGNNYIHRVQPIFTDEETFRMKSVKIPTKPIKSLFWSIFFL